MIELAGLVISGMSLANDLFSQHGDLASWSEQDIQVDSEWLPLALSKGVLIGAEEHYRWSMLSSVPTRTLKGTHELVYAYNKEKKIKYRILRGRTPEPLVLLRKR
jgi:hypothetical protein